MRVRKWYVMPAILCFLCLAAVCLGVSSPPAEAGEATIKIGTAGPLTGNQAKLGTDSRNGVMFAVDELNGQALTIGGAKVKFLVQGEDDQATPPSA